MTNLATVQLRLYFKSNQTTLPLQAMLKLLNKDADGSVPQHVRAHLDAHYVDIQCSSVWSPDVYKLWEKYSRRLNAIWYRWCFQEQDIIKWIFKHNIPDHQPCRYGFDTLKITWHPDKMPQDKDDRWKKQAESWSIKILGSYHAANHRTVPSANVLSLASVTTPVSPRLYDKLDWTSDQITLPSLAAVISQCEDNAEKIEFFWQNRLVRARYKVQDANALRYHWHEYCLDDWDNCIDENWLAYNSMFLKE